MRAAVNTRYGAPEVLSVTEVERPRLGNDEILVRVRASAVTHGDRRLRAADFPGVLSVVGRLMFGVLAPRNRVGGTSFAGRVVEVGRDVARLKVGDDVYGNVMNGAYGELHAVNGSDVVAIMPPSLSYAEAAALPYGAITALGFLRDLAKLKPRERVLVVGATGGVGRLAVQVAKRLGAHVTGVGHRGLERLRELGADEVIDYRAESFLAKGETWDVVFDTTEGNHFGSYRRVLTPTGRYLSVYITPWSLLEMAWTSMVGGQRAIPGAVMGSPALLDDLREMVEDGAVREPVGARYPLARIVEAHRALEADSPFGAIVVDVADAEEAPRLAGC